MWIISRRRTRDRKGIAVDKFLCMSDDEKKSVVTQDVDALNLDFKWVRKMPVVVAAVIYRGEGIWIQTLEGPLFAEDGCYIIRGIEGEYYPISAEIFAKTYTDV